MPTIKSVELNTNGSLQLITDTDAIINISPRILLDDSLTYIPPAEVVGGPNNADLTYAALLNFCADLTDRITHQEARLAELVNFIRQAANGLPKTQAPSEPEVSPTEVASAVQPEPEEVSANPDPVPMLPKETDNGPRIVQVTSLQPK